MTTWMVSFAWLWLAEHQRTLRKRHRRRHINLKILLHTWIDRINYSPAHHRFSARNATMCDNRVDDFLRQNYKLWKLFGVLLPPPHSETLFSANQLKFQATEKYMWNISFFNWKIVQPTHEKRKWKIEKIFFPMWLNTCPDWIIQGEKMRYMHPFSAEMLCHKSQTLWEIFAR